MSIYSHMFFLKLSNLFKAILPILYSLFGINYDLLQKINLLICNILQIQFILQSIHNSIIIYTSKSRNLFKYIQLHTLKSCKYCKIR